MIIFSGKIEGESFLVYNAHTCIRARRRAFISEGEAYIYIYTSGVRPWPSSLKFGLANKKTSFFPNTTYSLPP